MTSRIMVVDDDLDVREMLQLLLEFKGYEVVAVADGLQLLDALQRERTDLILLDVMMPGIDGIELCGRLKKNVELRAIPVVLISAHQAPGIVRRGFQAGCQDFFAKPIDVERLLIRIPELIGLVKPSVRRQRA